MTQSPHELSWGIRSLSAFFPAITRTIGIMWDGTGRHGEAVAVSVIWPSMCNPGWAGSLLDDAWSRIVWGGRAGVACQLATSYPGTGGSAESLVGKLLGLS